jgi:hypothetical protein
VNAGNSGGDQELSEAAFTAGRTKRHAIEKDLGTGSAEENTATTAFIEGSAELFPRRFELGSGSHVSELIQTREFQQNVEAADKRPRAATGFNAHTYRGEFSTPRIPLH